MNNDERVKKYIEKTHDQFMESLKLDSNDGAMWCNSMIKPIPMNARFVRDCDIDAIRRVKEASQNMHVVSNPEIKRWMGLRESARIIDGSCPLLPDKSPDKSD